jgi:hypothetical protein
METLSPYVAAILKQSSLRTIADETVVERLSWIDQGFEVTKEVTRYVFNDGAVIERTLEQDGFPSELACAECWITYRVIAGSHDGSEIQPASKTFDNACREAFWLAYHLA